MKIYYQIFEIRAVEEKVVFAGYSDGYRKEIETIYALVIPSWSWPCESQGEAEEAIKNMSDDDTLYEIKKVYKTE